MADEPLHEIQLNGKQLVFLFMSATVVAVVVFLLGVMVGRGVRAPQATVAETSAETPLDPTLPPPTTSAPIDGAPATAQETLTYASRLESATPTQENLREPGATPTPAREPETTAAPAPAPAAAPAPAPSPAPAPAPVAAAPARAPAASPAVALANEPSGDGFVVQVAATRARSEADTIARRLSGKGYPAFVTSPGANMFRVRVGKYQDRREAERVAGRLEREEQFKPWITR